MSSRYLFDGLEKRARDEALPGGGDYRRLNKKHPVDLIVMSSHGRTDLGHWLMDGVSEKVLQKAGCATLVVRPLVQSGNENRDSE